jgi:hypothetical protein
MDTIISSPFELISFGKYNYWGWRRNKPGQEINRAFTGERAAKCTLKEYFHLINPWHRNPGYIEKVTLCSGYTIVNVGMENIDTRLYLDITLPRDSPILGFKRV